MISRLLNKPKKQHKKDSHQIDLKELDESLNLLSTTAMEVSEAAVSAASVLQEELHASESRFHSTIDAINDLVIVKDGEGKWKTLNHWGQCLYNWHHGEYYDKTDEQLKALYPRLRESLTKCQVTDNQAWISKKTCRTEEFIPQSNFTYTFDILKTPVFNADGSRKELIIIGRDVTAVREKQKRTKACFNALNSASDIIFIVDKHRRMFFCNDRFVDIFDFGHYDNVVGKDMIMCVPYINSYDKMWETLESNKSWSDVYNNKFKLTIIPMMNGEPHPIYYICTMKPLF